MSSKMGKRKDESSEDEINVESVDLIRQKKHKKHKHKKHKKKRSLDKDESPDLLLDGAEERKRQLKMKIKQVEEVLAQKKLLGANTHASNTEATNSPSAGSSKDKLSSTSPKSSSKKVKKSKGKDSGTSSEEERWLDAIESGKLEEVDDELMKIKPKDPKLMTARQRAMLGRKSDGSPSVGSSAPPEELLALPSGYKERVMTAEMVQKAALKSQRRKQQADEKREKDKKKTMERLLKKQESKASKGSGLKGRSRKHIPHISYHSTRDGFSLCFPPEIDIPIEPTLPDMCLPPRKVLCAVNGCPNLKRYSCSNTGIPLCSLECYKKNLAGTGLGEEYT